MEISTTLLTLLHYNSPPPRDSHSGLSDGFIPYRTDNDPSSLWWRVLRNSSRSQNVTFFNYPLVEKRLNVEVLETRLILSYPNFESLSYICRSCPYKYHNNNSTKIFKNLDFTNSHTLIKTISVCDMYVTLDTLTIFLITNRYKLFTPRCV